MMSKISTKRSSKTAPSRKTDQIKRRKDEFKVENLTKQQEFYHYLRGQVQDLVGHQPLEIKKYAQRYEKELDQVKYQPTRLNVFLKTVLSNRLVLMGDFHAQPQSARSVLRLCRKSDSKNMMLALECFQSKDQYYIDQYLKGEITERDFLRAIEWKKNWGFPWEFTRPLVKWAIHHQVPIYGINLKGKRVKIKDRDRHAAQIICRLIKQNSEKKLIVQIGDFHLCQKHLPFEIKKIIKKLSVATVYQSPEALYFKAALSSRNKISDFYYLGKNRWSLMTVVPWVKWQDYLLYLESGNDHSVESAELDCTDHVIRFVQILADLMNFKISLDQISVYNAQDAQLSKKIKNLPALIKAQVRQQMSEGYSFFIPEIQTGVLSRLSVNHIARVAAQYILFQLKIFNQTLTSAKNEFVKIIWIEMLTYFMTKIANPKKKTDTMRDIRSALSRSHSDDHGKEVLSLALEQKMKEIKYINTGVLSSMSARRPASSRNYFVAAVILGGVLGEKIYHAYRKNYNTQFLFKPIKENRYELAYYTALETIEGWPDPFRSKYDQF